MELGARKLSEFLKEIPNTYIRELAAFNVQGKEDRLQKYLRGAFNNYFSLGIGSSLMWQEISLSIEEDKLNEKKLEEIVKKYELAKFYLTFKPKEKTLDYITGRYKSDEFKIYLKPFNNCQNFCIPSFNNILDSSDNEILYFVKNLPILTRKKLLIIDLNYKYCDIIDRLLKSGIVAKTPYISSNHSSMIMYIINCSLV